MVLSGNAARRAQLCPSLAGPEGPSGGSSVPSGGFPASKEVHGITLRRHLHPGYLGQVLWEHCCCLRHLFPENPSQVRFLDVALMRM